MGNYMKYLHIKCESANLILEAFDLIGKKKIPANVNTRIAELTESNPGNKFYVFGGDDISSPLKMENVSNMLSAFCNFRTVPSKPMVYNKIPKELELKRPEICDAVAKTGYVKYYSYIDNEAYVEQIIGDDGNYYNIYKNVYHPSMIGGGEMFKGEKTAFNSNVKNTTVIYDGEKPLNGMYDYQTLLQYFMDDYTHPLYVKMREFINNILGVSDFQKVYTFKQMANVIYDRRKNSADVDEKVNQFVHSIEKEWKEVAKKQRGESCFPVWMYAIFHQGEWSNSSNTNCRDDGRHSVTYRRLRRDINHYRIPVYAELIFKVTDPRFEDALRNGRGVASILDGGVCEICGLTEFEPEPNYEENWMKIC